MVTVSPEPFVGRERELSRLAVALESAASGSSRRLLIDGPGGIGASRLLDETARRVRGLAEPFEVIRCRAVAGRSLEPYAPLIDGLRTFLSGVDMRELGRLLGPRPHALARLLPDVVERLGAGPITQPAGFEVRLERRVTQTAEAILTMLERAGERRPVLLVIEDLHHADASTRAVAVFLSRVARPGRVCIVATYGSDAVGRGHPFLADLTSIADAADPPERMTLGPLVRDELASLIASREGERPRAALLLLVAERSGGNPLLAEEVLAARRELSGVSLGSSLEELVAARVGMRSAECRRVLRLLAPAEAPLRPDDLAAAAEAFERESHDRLPRSTGRPRKASGPLDPDLAAGLEEARSFGYLLPRSDTSLEIRHELVAHAIAADLLPWQRRRIHLALGEALAVHPGAAARHLLAAAEIARARDALTAAAVAAEGREAPADALAALEQAMELGAAGEDDRDATTALLIRAGDLALAAGRADRALAYLEAAGARLRQDADRTALASLHERLGRVARVLGDHDRALREHRRAAEELLPGPSLLRAEVTGSLAQTLMLLGLFGDAEGVAEEAIDVARSLGPEGRGAEGHATCTLGIIRVWGADPLSGVELLETARTIAREVGDADDWFRSILNLSTALTLVHRPEEAVALTLEAIEEARQEGLEAAYGSALRGNVTEALFLTGRWVEARDMIRTALQWSPAADVFADAAITAGVLEVESASDERAARLLGRRLLDLRNAPDPQSVIHASRAVAHFDLWRNDIPDAARAADQGWATVRRSEDWMLSSRMAATYLEVQCAIVADAHERRALHEIGAAREKGRKVLLEAELALRASGVPSDAPSRRDADAHLQIARAYAARLDGRDDPAVWDALAQVWETIADPYQVARARWRQAEAALGGHEARSGRAAARGPILEALRIARELGARPLLAALEQLARRALIALPPASGDETPAPAPDAVDAEPLRSLDPSGAARVATSNGHRRQRDRRSAGHAAAGPGAAASSLVAAFVAAGDGTRPDAGFGLSAREREVLAQIVEGRTNREIGERLFISQKTVGVHVGNILAKLGVSGRVEAAMVAVRLDLVPSR